MTFYTDDWGLASAAFRQQKNSVRQKQCWFIFT